MLKIEKRHYDGYVYDISMKKNANFFANGICIHNCAKKRNIMNVYDDEGVRYAEPKMKMTGVEAIKSSTPAPCRDALKTMFKIIMTGTESEMQTFVKTFRTKFEAMGPEMIAFPRGVSKLKTYLDKQSIVKKGAPINSRAAILFNHLLTINNLNGQYDKIEEGDKIKYIYLKNRNPIASNVIGFSSVLPHEFKLHAYIDYELQFTKSFIDPAALVLNAVGWTPEESSSLDLFFG